MVRKEGSGLANDTAAAVEELLAARLEGDNDAAQISLELLRREHLLGRCGVEPQTIDGQIGDLLDVWGPSVVHATAQPADQLGDVKFIDHEGIPRWIEVKAQTTKNSFRDITQADWVRDATDFLGVLVELDPEGLSTMLPQWVIDALDLPSDAGVLGLDELWVADQALLVNRAARARARALDPAGLWAFLEAKHILHLTRAGVRLIRLSDVPSLQAAMDGRGVHVVLNYGNQTSVSIPTACPGPWRRGLTHFTYHVGYDTGVLGRHKMHALSLERSPSIEITL